MVERHSLVPRHLAVPFSWSWSQSRFPSSSASSNPAATALRPPTSSFFPSLAAPDPTPSCRRLSSWRRHLPPAPATSVKLRHHRVENVMNYVGWTIPYGLSEIDYPMEHPIWIIGYDYVKIDYPNMRKTNAERHAGLITCWNKGGMRNRLDRASRKYILWLCRGCSTVDPITGSKSWSSRHQLMTRSN